MVKRNLVNDGVERSLRAFDNVVNDVKGYSKLESPDDAYLDSQFRLPPPKIPWKAIVLATVLFVLGSLLIIIGALLLAGYIDAKYSDRTWPVLILGAIMFVPGFYHVHLAYGAFRGYKGYTFDDIPDMD